MFDLFTVMKMSKRPVLGVNVSLSGEDLDAFNRIKKNLYLGNDAEILRMCLRFYDENSTIVQRLKELDMIDKIEMLPSLYKEIADLKAQVKELREK